MRWWAVLGAIFAFFIGFVLGMYLLIINSEEEAQAHAFKYFQRFTQKNGLDYSKYHGEYKGDKGHGAWYIEFLGCPSGYFYIIMVETIGIQHIRCGNKFNRLLPCEHEPHTVSQKKIAEEIRQEKGHLSGSQCWQEKWS